MSQANPRTIPQVVAQAAQRFGSRPAIEDGDTTLSFEQLADAGVRACRAFMASGVSPGDRVALWSPNAWEWVVAAIGLQSAGAVLVPLNTRLKGFEASGILRASGATMLGTVDGFLDTDYVGSLEGEELPELRETILLRGDREGCTSWKDFLARSRAVDLDTARERADAVSPDDLSDMLFTSGTTGAPKGVMTAHGQNIQVFEAWSDGVGLREGDRYIVVMPFFHSFGYKAGWLSCLLKGATCLPEPVFEARRVLERIAAEKITVFPGAPALYQTLLAMPELAEFDTSSLRLAVTGAASIPVELVERMRDELGFDSVITAYGLTESCGTVTMCVQGDDPETIATTSGRAIPGVEVQCVDAEGKSLPAGEPGEVVVRGYNVMQGYFRDEAETAKTIDADGWLHTGDVGILDERGYLRITDRVKDMFIMGGFNCYPAEIENLMFRHDEIAQVAVVGVPDERMGEVAMAFVVPVPGATLNAEGVIAWCRDNMANYKVPRRVEVVDELPMNASGKVTKFVLRERAMGGA